MEVDCAPERARCDAENPREDHDLSDEVINRALRWREIGRHLAQIRSILTASGGTRTFSTRLARRGVSLTHVDVSPAMLKIARRRTQGLETVAFPKVNDGDLSHGSPIAPSI